MSQNVLVWKLFLLYCVQFYHYGIGKALLVKTFCATHQLKLAYSPQAA